MKVRAIKQRSYRAMGKRLMTPWRWRTAEDLIWDRITPVGREFGSPDFDRLMEMDAAAFAAFGTVESVRKWSDTPNDQLGGLTPEYAVRTPDGWAKVMHILKAVG